MTTDMKRTITLACPYCDCEFNKIIEINELHFYKPFVTYCMGLVTKEEYKDREDSPGCGKYFVVDLSLNITINTFKIEGHIEGD